MRKWGQHFLASEALQKKIAASCEIGLQDEVLEIGPGRGELTRHYIEKASRAVLVEIDPALARKLRERWGRLPQTVILNADFRKISPDSLGFSRDPVVLSDLPYYASKPILRKILEWGNYSRAVLVFQKEVALRLTASKKDSQYSALSLITQLYAAVEKLFDIKPGSFRPAPKVESSVLRFRPAPFNPEPSEREKIVRVIRIAFAQARKTLVNNLCGGIPGLSKKETESMLAGMGLPASARAHELDLPAFQMLARSLLEKNNSAAEKNNPFDEDAEEALL